MRTIFAMLAISALYGWKTKKAFISIALVIGLLGSSIASATVIAFEAVNAGPGGPIAAHLTYDAATHVFTANTPFGRPGSPATLEFVSPGLIQDLVVGTFLMIADIDNAGVLHSGGLHLERENSDAWHLCLHDVDVGQVAKRGDVRL